MDVRDGSRHRALPAQPSATTPRVSAEGPAAGAGERAFVTVLNFGRRRLAAKTMRLAPAQFLNIGRVRYRYGTLPKKPVALEKLRCAPLIAVETQRSVQNNPRSRLPRRA